MTTRQLASPTRAHPRSRGENPFCAVMRISWLGSSPLTRGKRFTGCESLGSFGLIPAHAGKTSTRPCRRSRASAHPRSRGENTETAFWWISSTGSSPLTQGKRIKHLLEAVPGGLIPAHAGKTAAIAWQVSTARVHPHARGENANTYPRFNVDAGSSPLAREKLVDPEAHGRAVGLIPARAGKTRP